MIRARGHACVRGLALAALLVADRARADGAVKVEGRVRDGQGQAVPGADVVVTDLGGRQRRAAIADEDGHFVLELPDAGARRISFYTERGARVVPVILSVQPGRRVWLDADDGGANTRVRALDGDDALPGGVAAELARDRDLRTAVAAFAGVGAPAVPADGPVVLGTDPAEAQLRLDGFLLNDPVDGRAPWELPAGLFAAITPEFGLGETGGRGASLAEVAMASRRAERETEGALTLGGAFAAPAGEAQGSERPTGWSNGGFAEAAVGAVRAGGQLRGHLSLAPGRLPFVADPESVTAMRGRQARAFPVLARADAEAGGWELGLLGLGSFDRWTYGRAARILPPRDPTARARDLLLVGTTARRPAAAGPGQLLLQASLLRAATRTELSDAPMSRTVGSRFSLVGRLSGEGRLYGWHLFAGSAGTDVAWAHRPGSEPGRQAGVVVSDARASSRTPWVAFDESYRPVPRLELDLGLRLEKTFFSGRAGVEGAPAGDRSFDSGLLVAPRAQACYRPDGGTFCLTAGRFGAGLPLFPLLDTTTGPPGSLPAPAEDAALAIARFGLQPVAFSLFAFHRQLAHLIEDRFSPVDGHLELHQPRAPRRRMQAVGASLSFQGTRSRAGAGVLIGRLSGNHVGYLDPSSGQTRPGATGEWDGLESVVNRDGPLPFDRPFSARLSFEHARPLAGFDLRLLALGRWDAGTPLSALGRSPESGVGQVFLVQRGSLGRTSAVPGVDLALQIAHAFGAARVWLAFEGFNVTNQRPVVARDQVYTDLAAPPLAGASRKEALGNLVDRDGNPVAARPSFGNPVAWAEPLLLRLALGFTF